MSADADRAHRTQIQMRFSDTDALGHVNNASYAVYAELARLEFMQHVGKVVRALILAHLAIDFRRQVALGDRVVVSTTVARIGTSSVTLQQTVWANQQPAAEIRSVVVHFDYATQRPVPLPDDVRAQLAGFVVADSGPASVD